MGRAAIRALHGAGGSVPARSRTWRARLAAQWRALAGERLRERLGRRRTLGVAVGIGLLCLAAMWLRLRQRHDGLLYPDAYQYLLMARGIAEHLRPTTVLGTGGDHFIPSFDAATKPLYAAVVAVLVEFGIHLRSAGGIVSAVGGGFASVAGALLVLRLTRSVGAAFVCGAALLASPALGFWWGFAGPDGLAVALALLAAWLAARSGGVSAGVAAGSGSVRAGVAAGSGGVRAGVGARSAGVSAGVAAGLAVATRPELGVVVIACIAGALMLSCARATALRAGAAAIATVGLVYLTLRPPLEWSTQFLLAPLAGLVGGGVVALAWKAAATRRAAGAALVAAAAGLVALAAAGRTAALADVGRAEWPLLAGAALAGVALWRAERRRTLLVLLAIGGCLAAVYAYKNANSERYVANLLPLAAVLIALGVAAARAGRRRLLLAGIVALVALDPVLASTPPAPGLDPFDDVAPQLAALPPGPLVSGTPDAYGVLLPGRASRLLRSGARGYVVLDAGQRYYRPGFAARGKVIFKTFAFYGFVRPDGTVDRGPTTVVDGIALRSPSVRRP